MKIVKYSAEWCGPCKAFAPVVEKVSQELNIPLEKVDIEETPVEGITSIPTVRLVADDGSVLAEHNGRMTPPAFREWVMEHKQA